MVLSKSARKSNRDGYKTLLVSLRKKKSLCSVSYDIPVSTPGLCLHKVPSLLGEMHGDKSSAKLAGP